MDVHPTSAGTRTGAFTLIELITVLAMVVIVFGLGIPSLHSLLGNNSVTAAVNSMTAYLHLARSESVRRGVQVVLCPSLDREYCANSRQWHRGFIVYADDNHNRQRDSEEQLVRYHHPGGRGIKILTSPGRKKLIYKPSGMAPGSTATITVCHENESIQPKAVILSNPGRPRLSKTKPDGSPLVCG